MSNLDFSQPWIQLSNGVPFFFHEEDTVSTEVIDALVTGISRIDRFNGASHRPWSVCNHSILCHEIAPVVCEHFVLKYSDYDDDVAYSLKAAHQKEALLHDLHEGGTTDLPSPIKRLLGKTWKDFEDKVQDRVLRYFNLDRSMLSSVLKYTDYAALYWEANGPVTVEAYDWGFPDTFKDAAFTEALTLSAKNAVEKYNLFNNTPLESEATFRDLLNNHI